MFEACKTISLVGGKAYITEHEYDAFRVKSGSVLIYIVPIVNGTPGRRSFLYEANVGEVFPSFVYRDMEYKNWRFCIVAMDKATIEVIESGATKVLKQRFSEKANVKNFKREGYEGGLVDQYRINTVKEDGYIRRNQHAKLETSETTLSLIYRSFKKKGLYTENEKTGLPIYDAVSLLCSNLKINIAPFEKIKEACGDTVTISDIARVSHFAYRKIVLTSGWQKEDGGPFLVFDNKNKPLVCIPTRSNSYILYDVETGSGVPVSSKVAQSISPNAHMIYRSFPFQQLNIKSIVEFCRGSIKTVDVVYILFLSIVTALIGLIVPTISQSLYDEYIPLGAETIVFQMGCLMASFMIGTLLFSVVKNVVSFRISSKVAYDIQSAVYDRVFNLPEKFFRNYESAELAQHIMATGNVVNSATTIVLSCFVAIFYVLFYFIKMARCSWRLALISVLMVTVYSALYYYISISAQNFQKKVIEFDGKSNSLIFQLLSGISKIRIAGVEDKALYEYLKPYVKLRENEAKKNTVVNFRAVLMLISNSIFSLVLYCVMIKGKVDISIGSFVAFSTVFGSFVAYLMQIVQGVSDIKGMQPFVEKIKPILEFAPEYDDTKDLPGDISGSIEINNVTFSYSEGAPNVLENINLNIRAGEYVGIVGPSGCGKSTLIKLLLGFERSSAGKIYYDNKDIESIDKRELRKKMGVVLQDGKLVAGSIYDNITISAPSATISDVQDVIKAVGLEADIKEMPMGLHTVLSEDSGTISGGQQQRILIARALIAKPKVIFFDEATSALDNVTQRMVCESLEQIKATRIVIAHRLSTIMKCDRIIVLDSGKVVEQGSFETLMKNEGMFYQLARRQLL